MKSIRRVATYAVLAALSLVGAAFAEAPPVDLTAFLSDQECSDVVALDGILYGALKTGGVAVWSEDDPSDFSRWTMMDGLSSNRINDLDWSGEHLWIATSGGGLTRATLTSTGPVFRQYIGLGSLASLNVATVATVTSDGSERVFYGLADGGVGIIIDGFAGNIFSADNFEGLVNDQIRALAFQGDDLWIGTADGISIYSEGIFLDRSAGLVDRSVHDLILGADGLFAATEGGVFRWSATSAAWEPLGDPDTGVIALEEFGGDLWSVTGGSGTSGRLRRWDGAGWTAEDVPEGLIAGLAASDKLWLCGQSRPVTDNHDANRAFLAVRDAADDWRTWTWDNLLFNEVDGVEITPDGTVWLGSRVAAAWSGWDGESWTQFPELASAENDSLGLINFGSNLLNLESSDDGTLWITQFARGGIIRYRPWLDDADIILTANSALSNRRIVRMLALPGGAMLFMSDFYGVDLLLDADAWTDPQAWRVLPSDGTGLGGLIVRDAAQTRADQIWFSSEDGGLVLWDTNGAAGPDDDLTLGDFSDDYWTPAQTTIGSPEYKFLSIKGLAAGEDGTLWAAGAGVIQLGLVNYDDDAIYLTVLGRWGAKDSPDVPGLLIGSFTDIEIDGNGDVWVCSEAGIDRIRYRNEVTEIDNYTNANAYESFSLRTVFGTSIIRGIPEGPVRELDVADDGRSLIAGCGYGAVLIELGRAQAGETNALDRLTVYPNPYHPNEQGEGLMIGGYESDVDFTSTSVVGGAWIEIYDLEGKLVYRNRHVEQNTAFWYGRNLDGGKVATGTYMLRAELGGQIVVKPLAVVR